MDRVQLVASKFSPGIVMYCIIDWMQKEKEEEGVNEGLIVI